jgi:hypothetical protein
MQRERAGGEFADVVGVEVELGSLSGNPILV